MKVPSLSWIEPAELSESLRRAGVIGGGGPADDVLPPAHRSETASRPNPDRASRPTSHQPDDGGSLESRLKGLVAWVARQIRAEQAFIADADGLVLTETETNSDLVAVSTMFTNVLNSLPTSFGATPGSLILELKEGTFLQLLQTETLLGRTTLGFVVKKSAPPEVIDILRDGLLTAIGPTEDAAGEKRETEKTDTNIDHSGGSHINDGRTP